MKIEMTHTDLAKIVNNVKLEILVELEEYLCSEYTESNPHEKGTIIVESDHLIEQMKEFKVSHKAMTVF
ncbi:MAG: hypothetical protein COB15_09640 [Flavobacteriales bacterium]|nr:MAG: hypothetical protein COB15_09640 [Flavobacteriales bacterium]